MDNLLRLGLIYTLACNASCGHCCFESHPRVQSKMKLEEAFHYIDQAFESSAFDKVGISGGEALLYEDEVVKIIEYASSLGFKTSLTTNGFWGKTPEDALHKLKSLKEKGLNELVLSTDEFHQPFVPYGYIENILTVNERVQIPIKIYEILVKGSSMHPLQMKYSHYSWHKGACVPMGRAREIPIEELICGDYSGRCTDMDKLTILPDGSCYPCCSPGIKGSAMGFGSAYELSLDELLKAKENSIFLNIITWRGPKWLKEFGEAKGCFLKNKQNKYVSMCHLCHEIAGDADFLRNMEPFMKEFLLGLQYAKYLKL